MEKVSPDNPMDDPHSDERKWVMNAKERKEVADFNEELKKEKIEFEKRL